MELGRIDRFMPIAIFGKMVQRYSISAQPSEGNCFNFIRGRIKDRCLKYRSPTGNGGSKRGRFKTKEK